MFLVAQSLRPTITTLSQSHGSTRYAAPSRAIARITPMRAAAAVAGDALPRPCEHLDRGRNQTVCRLWICFKPYKQELYVHLSE